MAATHTPGPWVYGPEVGVDSTRIESCSGRVIGAIRTREVTDWQHGHPIYSWSEEGASNARLAASAPELLAALQLITQWRDTLAATSGLSAKPAILEDFDDAIAAIAKATGK